MTYLDLMAAGAEPQSVLEIPLLTSTFRTPLALGHPSEIPSGLHHGAMSPRESPDCKRMAYAVKAAGLREGSCTKQARQAEAKLQGPPSRAR